MYKTPLKKRAHASDFDLYDDLEKIKSALADATYDVKGRAGELLSQGIDDVKRRSLIAQENAANYVADKPFKSLGIALLTGLFIGYFLHK